MNCGGLLKATHRCMVCSSSNLVSGGHGDMALNQQKHAAPRQWHGKGSEGQVPTQHQHAAPYMYDGPSTLGLRQEGRNSTTQVPCAPHHEFSVKGQIFSRLSPVTMDAAFVQLEVLNPFTETSW